MKDFSKMCAAFVAAVTLASCAGDKEVEAFSCQAICRECAELATVEYTYDMLFQNEPTKLEKAKLGDRIALYSGEAYVKAGIDIEDVGSIKSKISEDGRSIDVVLPMPKILQIKFEEEGVHREFEKVDFFRWDFDNEERHEIRVNAMKDFEKKLSEEGNRYRILSDAEQNIRTEMEILLLATGMFDTVNISFNRANQSEGTTI